MSKTPRAMVINYFLHLCKDMGKSAWVHESDLKATEKHFLPIVAWKPACPIVENKTIGSWSLSESSSYGGYVIQEMMNGGGGIRHPLGDTRHKATQFVDMMWFARECLRIQKEGR